MTQEHYHGLWRAAAMESVPYTEDFPESLLCFPELTDGSIGQGKATTIWINFVYNKDNTITGTVKDNGFGIKNLRRLLEWAADHSTDNMHRNGHGVKKALSKFCRDFSSAKWRIRYRKKGMNLQVISPPFLGPLDTKVEEDENDEITLFPHGTEISFTFPNDVIGLNPQELLVALREILRSRYSENIFNRVEFDIQIQSSDDKLLRENSKFNFDKTGKQTSPKSENARWHSFQWYLEEMCKGKNPEAIKVVNTVVHQIEGGSWTFSLYSITVSGNKTFTLKKPDFFPVYGRKNQSAQRIHTGLEDRFIEPIPIHKILGKEASHNDHNGFIGFIQFKATSEETFSKLPPPATTKVSFYENDPVFRTFMKDLRKDLDVALKTISKVEAPKPEPKVVIEVPKPQPKVEIPKPEPKVEPKPEPKVEPKPEPKVEVPKPEPKVKIPKPEPKVEVSKPEPKVEVSKPVVYAGSNAANFDITQVLINVPAYQRMGPVSEQQFLMRLCNIARIVNEKQIEEKVRSASLMSDPVFAKYSKMLDEVYDYVNEKMK